jgi:hypothetical protein
MIYLEIFKLAFLDIFAHNLAESKRTTPVNAIIRVVT